MFWLSRWGRFLVCDDTAHHRRGRTRPLLSHSCLDFPSVRAKVRVFWPLCSSGGQGNRQGWLWAQGITGGPGAGPMDHIWGLGLHIQGHQSFSKGRRGHRQLSGPVGASGKVFPVTEPQCWVDGALEGHLEADVTSGADKLKLNFSQNMEAR
jgi:hypothetical protein